MSVEIYKQKYLKYKQKYLELKGLFGGGNSGVNLDSTTINPTYNLPNLDYSSVTMEQTEDRMNEYLNENYDILPDNFGHHNNGIYVHRTKKLLIKHMNFFDYKTIRTKDALNMFAKLYRLYIVNKEYYHEEERMDGVICDIIIKDFPKSVKIKYGDIYESMIKKFVLNMEDFDKPPNKFYISSWGSYKKHTKDYKNTIINNLYVDFSEIDWDVTKLIINEMFSAIKTLLVNIKVPIDILFENFEKTGHEYTDLSYDNIGYNSAGLSHNENKIKHLNEVDHFVQNMRLKFIDPEGVRIPKDIKDIEDMKNQRMTYLKKINNSDDEYYNFLFSEGEIDKNSYVYFKEFCITYINDVTLGNENVEYVTDKINKLYDIIFNALNESGL